MVEVMPSGSVLSDSLHKPRPHFSAYFKYDNNGLNEVQQIEEKRRIRQMKFPSLVGRKEPDSLKTPQTPTDPAYKKWNDEGDYRPPAPYRSCDNIIDPVSGFVSTAGDVDRNTGHSHIPSMVQLNTTPQSRAPQDINSIRAGDKNAPPETQRSSERDAGMPYSWNSRQVSDASLRASLGGWTSDPAPPKEKSLQEKLAHRYTYTSSTQRAYEEVPWDNILHSKQFPPTSTLEERPDMISQCFSRKRYESQAEEWQRLGRSWDRFQTRRGYYKTDIPIPGVVFCSPCPRANQIPLYGGCIGGDNLDEIDNRKESFTPYTVKRNPIPWVSETSHRPNIPNYAGCTWYRPDTAPANSSERDRELTTTGRVHRPFSLQSRSDYGRTSIMSKMMTTVPPGNPFTKVTQPGDPIPIKTPNKGQRADAEED